MTGAPPPELVEAMVVASNGARLGVTPASWSKRVRVRLTKEGIATELVLKFKDGQQQSIPLPPQLVGPPHVIDFGRMQFKRVMAQ